MTGGIELVREGRVWKFGDLVNTDMIMPGTAFRLPKGEQHTLCFESVRPGWAREVAPGDIIVAGHDFGMGSSRPIGDVLRACGIAAVVADSINGLALRNCINASLPGLSCPGVAALFEDGERARVDFLAGRIDNLSRGGFVQAPALVPLLAGIVGAGGVIAMLVKDGDVEAVPFVAASR
ncbi:MAG: 3-isopropylmalate dehydratase [Burkholderiales bacterium]|nr:3-isopropylmalate dehydratase [Burkholderiales bacterium]